MMKWAFGANREEYEQDEELTGDVEPDPQQPDHDLSQNGSAVDEDEDLLFDPPSVAAGENADDPLGESVESPERHAQLSLLTKIRKDIDDFDNHITQNEIQLKHSREQLIGFKTFVQQTDAEMEQIYRLRKRSDELERELTSQERKSGELQNVLDIEKSRHAATRNRNLEFKGVLNSARGEIVSLAEQNSKLREKLEKFSSSSDLREGKFLDVTRQAERLSAENIVLDDNYQRASLEMNVLSKKATELQKKLDEMVDHGHQDTAEVDRITAKLTSATDVLDKYQAENVELLSKLETMMAESAASDKRNNNKVRLREEEMFSLRSQVKGLQSELRVRNQMLNQSVDESKKARSEMKISLKATKELGEELEREVSQHQEQREQLLDANSKISEVNNRYKEMLSELEHSRQENLRLKRLLKTELQAFEKSINKLPVAKNDKQEHFSQADAKTAKLN